MLLASGEYAQNVVQSSTQLNNHKGLPVLPVCMYGRGHESCVNLMWLPYSITVHKSDCQSARLLVHEWHGSSVNTFDIEKFHIVLVASANHLWLSRLSQCVECSYQILSWSRDFRSGSDGHTVSVSFIDTFNQLVVKLCNRTTAMLRLVAPQTCQSQHGSYLKSLRNMFCCYIAQNLLTHAGLAARWWEVRQVWLHHWVQHNYMITRITLQSESATNAADIRDGQTNWMAWEVMVWWGLKTCN